MRPLSFLFTSVLARIAYSHTVITYPGDRGNNLIKNETFPYSMQWVYPCKHPDTHLLSLPHYLATDFDDTVHPMACVLLSFSVV